MPACGQPITITGGHTWYFGGEADGEDGVRRKDGRQVLDPAVADSVAQAGVAVTRTLAVGGFMLKELRARRELAPLGPQDQRALDRWERMFDENLAHVGRMREAGVRWVAGTDAGWRHTVIDRLPLELMRQGGMSAMEAIVAATGFAAEVIGISDRVGTLKPGMLADVIVVDRNPLDDLSRLGTLRMVMQEGRVQPLAAR